MENKKLLDVLNEEFVYVDGNLYRKVGSTNDRYVCAQVNNERYGVHQLVFLMHHGYMPQHVDHIDGNGFNNKIENLRASTPMQNQMNSKLRKSNTSGVKGVNWHTASNKWIVRMRCNGDRMYLGAYEDLELAELVANEARNKYHGEFARHN
jgi:hypothetical protein